MDVAKFRMRKFSRSMRLESVGELQVRKKSANLTRSIFKFVVDFHISLRCRGGAANLTRSIFKFVVDFHISLRCRGGAGTLQHRGGPEPGRRGRRRQGRAIICQRRWRTGGVRRRGARRRGGVVGASLERPRENVKV